MNATVELERQLQPEISISEVKVRLVDDNPDNLVGWASCVVNGALYLNNIAVRRGHDGGLVLVYPGKKSKSDQKYFYFNPITRSAKEALDVAILGKLQGADRHGV